MTIGNVAVDGSAMHQPCVQEAPPLNRVGYPQAPMPAEWTMARYREQLAWPVRLRGGNAVLSLGKGLAAVAVPATVGAMVAIALRRGGATGPVLTFLGEPQIWVFLADPNGSVLANGGLPDGVTVLSCPVDLKIPATDVCSDQSSWIVPPDPRRRWFPTVDAVIAAVRVCHRGRSAPVVHQPKPTPNPR